MQIQEPSSPFKVKFNTYSYKDILPDIQEYKKHDFIINQEHRDKGRIEKMIWQRYVPEEGQIDSQEYRAQELRRILYTGAWIWIKDYIIWLPPNYYFALQYGCTGEDPLQFRIKRLKHKYFKIRARNNPNCKGTFTVKNRQDGETTDSMHDNLWECADGMTYVGQIGIQSKTREDAQNPCWLAVKTLWNQLEPWIKDELYSDFTSGDNIAEKLEFQRKKEDGKRARNILMRYYPAVYNAMDGKNNMRKCVLDEVLKWIECSFVDALECYTRFIMPGFERRGLFDIFSSPPAIDCKSYREGYQVYQDSDPSEITDNGTTKSRLHRYRSDPLEGIQGAYDMYGDADANQIYDHIMRERKNCDKDKLPGLIRDFALTEEETWGSLDAASNTWSNAEGIKERKTFLIGHKYKNAATKEPARIYGNLEWHEGVLDTDVDLRLADLDHFDKYDARFCFSYLIQPEHKEELAHNHLGKPIPPAYIENCLGLDPFNHRYKVKDRPSDQAMVNRRFRDLFQTGIRKVPTMIYCMRPDHQEIAFEDALKAAVFNRALIQYENRNDKFENYAEDRGYWDWLLPAIGDTSRKGDAPTGKGAFLDEGIALLDAATNKPLTPDGVYYLLQYWFPELLTDYLKFNRQNTQSANLTMADFQALIGCVKIMHKKIRQPSDLNNAVLDYLFT